jgi:uncharacterized protein
MTNFNFGLKPGVGLMDPDSDVWESPDLVRLDYIQYQSPCTKLKKFVNQVNYKPEFFIPHSVNLSLASEQPLPISTLKLLKEECELTKTEYLGEHIGVLNYRNSSPSLGYILPIDLNKKTAYIIADNVKRLQDYIGIPVALENVVHYTTRSNSQYNFPQYIEYLSEVLPTETEWLIDYSHLLVSSGNLGNFTLEEAIKSYAVTGRRIREIHISGVRRGANGVFHDDHSCLMSEQYLMALSDLLHKYSIEISNITYEKDVSNNAELLEALSEITLIEKVLQPSEDPFTKQTQINLHSSTEQVVRSESENSGRTNIAINRIQTQLPDFFSNHFEDFLNILSLNRYEFGNQFISNDAEYFKYSIPFYSKNCADNIDLSLSFYLYCHEVLSKIDSIECDSILNNLLLEIACNNIATRSYLDEKEISLHYIKIDHQTGMLDAGIYQLLVEDGNINAENISLEKYAQISAIGAENANVFFYNNGDLSWKRKFLIQKAQKRKPLSKLTKNQSAKKQLNSRTRGNACEKGVPI